MATAIGFLSNLDPDSEVLSDGTVRLADGSILRPPQDVQRDLRMQASRAAQVRKNFPPRPAEDIRPPTQDELLTLGENVPGLVGVAASLEKLRRDEDRTALDFGLAGLSAVPGGKALRSLLKRARAGNRSGQVVEDIVMEGDEFRSTRRIEPTEDVVLETADDLRIPDRQEVIDILVDDGLEATKAEKLADAMLQLSRAGFESATLEVLDSLERGTDVDEIVKLINKHLGKVQ